MLARREAELKPEGVCNIIIGLAKAFPDRTYNAIQGHRSSQGYKYQVTRFIEEIRRRPTPAPSVDNEVAAEEEEDDVENISDAAVLPHLLPSSPTPPSWTRPSRARYKEANFQSFPAYLREILQARARGPTRRNAGSPPNNNNAGLPGSESMEQPHATERTRNISTILDSIEEYSEIPRERMELYWQTVFTRPASDTKSYCSELPPVQHDWRHIPPEEIRGGRPLMTVSPGPGELSSH